MIEVLTKLQTDAEALGDLKNLSLKDVDYTSRENQLKDTWSSFNTRLQQRIGEQDTPAKLSVFIKLTQQYLTDFADKVFEYFKGVESPNRSLEFRIKSLFGDIGDEIEKVLKFLQNNFSKHFNYSARVPKWITYADKEVLSQKYKIIHGLEMKNVDSELILILGNFLENFQDPENHVMNWYQYDYLTKLASELIFFVESSDASFDTIRLIKLLIGYNFNPLVFYEFMLEFATRFAGTDAPYEEQEMELLTFLKIIENIRPEIKSGYNPDVPPIIESVSGSIRRELEMITKMKEVQVPAFVGATNGKSSWYYFEVASTLEELFFLIKIMVEVRFIKTRYKANLYSFVERHIRTDRTKKPSPQYMRNIFGPNREVPAKVIRKVRSWLMTLINYIDTHFVEQLKMLCIIWFLGDPTILDLLTASPIH